MPQLLGAGTYSTLDVTGVCDISHGPVTVTGDVTVATDAALVSAYGMSGSSLTVGGNLHAATGASLVLGCEPIKFVCLDDPNPSAPTLTSTATIGGDLVAASPLGIILHRTAIAGDFTSTGGGNGQTCANSAGANVFYALPGNGQSVYSDFEDSTVGGNVTWTGLTSCWFGALRDTIGGSATFSGLTFMSFDAIEIVNNEVHGNLLCTGDFPHLTYGDTGQSTPDLVGGYGTGDCSFTNIVQYGPGPPPTYLPIARHDPAYDGYWLAASDGGIFAFNSPFYGSGASQALPIGGFSPVPGARGYQLATTTGSALPFGAGSCSGSVLSANRPVVGMAAAPGGDGCWLVASDGGIFAYGPNAPFFGSAGAIALTRPVVGMAAAPNGDGYYLDASDGGVFAYGPGATFQGSMGGLPLNKPIVGMAVDPTTGGYWLVAADGGIFSFDAPYFGSMGGRPLNQPIVGMAAAPGGDGYYLVASDGGIFTFGPGAVFQGSTGAIALARPVIGMALGG